jgi:mannose/fructose/N-acetylgalactosamine-specific phosphotransferase system component IID
MKDLLDSLLAIVYNLVILSGTVYLIAERDWNPWWMLLAIMLLASKTKD